MCAASFASSMELDPSPSTARGRGNCEKASKKRASVKSEFSSHYKPKECFGITWATIIVAFHIANLNATNFQLFFFGQFLPISALYLYAFCIG